MGKLQAAEFTWQTEIKTVGFIAENSVLLPQISLCNIWFAIWQFLARLWLCLNLIWFVLIWLHRSFHLSLSLSLWEYLYAGGDEDDSWNRSVHSRKCCIVESVVRKGRKRLIITSATVRTVHRIKPSRQFSLFARYGNQSKLYSNLCLYSKNYRSKIRLNYIFTYLIMFYSFK